MPRGGTWGTVGGSNFFLSEIQPDLVEISSENIDLFDLGSLVSLSMKHYPCLIIVSTDQHRKTCPDIHEDLDGV